MISPLKNIFITRHLFQLYPGALFPFLLNIGLIRVAILLYPPPTRPLGPLPAPYPIPRGYLIHTGQKIK